MGDLYLATDESLDNLVGAAQAAATDDTTAMTEILTRFDGAAWAIARSLTSNWCLQQDAAQEARLALVKAMQGKERCVDPQEYVWPDMTSHNAAPDTTFEVIDLLTALSPEQQTITK